MCYLRSAAAGGVLSLSPHNDIGSFARTVAAVGVPHGVAISVGFCLLKPETLWGTSLTGILSTEVLLLVMLLCGIAYLLAGSDYTVSSVLQVASLGVTWFVILTIVLLPPTLAITAAIAKTQSLILGYQY